MPANGRWDLIRRLKVIALGTYHGASVIMHSTFDWNRSSISRFEFDAVPHSWIPLVQPGDIFTFRAVTADLMI